MGGSVLGILMVAVIVVLVVIAGMTPFLLALIVPVAGFFLLLPLFTPRTAGACAARAAHQPPLSPRTTPCRSPAHADELRVLLLTGPPEKRFRFS